MTQDQAQPFDLDLEAVVLGTILLSPQAEFPKAADLITEPVFYSTAHQLIWRIMKAHFEKGTPPDINAVLNTVKAKKIEARVGGIDLIRDLIEVAHPGLIEAHCASLQELYAYRCLIESATEMIELAHKRELPAADLIDRSERRLSLLAFGRRTEQARNAQDIMREAWAKFKARREEIEERKARGEDVHDILPGLPTGLHDLDLMTGGMVPKTLTIIAARPSVGKSALAVSMIEHQVINKGLKIGLISLEMGDEELAHRLIAIRTGRYDQRISTLRVKNPVDVTEAEVAAVYGATKEPRWTNLWIAEGVAFHLPAMRREIRRLHRREGVEAFYVDYLQLMEAGERQSQNRNLELGEITRGLKLLTKELNVPIVCLSQLSRDPAKGNREPRLSDLRESGAIEQDADVVIFIHRDGERWEPKPLEDGRFAVPEGKLIVAKNRNGPTDSIPIRFEPEITHFRSSTWRDS